LFCSSKWGRGYSFEYFYLTGGQEGLIMI